MPGLLERIKSGETLLSDGAMGTMLFARGLKAGECPECVNLSHPARLEEIAAAYLEAGADIVSTNTFGGSPLKLAQYSLDDETERINVSAVRAARKAAGNNAFVAASVGPTGQLLQPYGEASTDQVAAAFDRQLKAILSENIDAVFIETMTDLSEAVLAVKAAKALAPDIPVSATLTFDATPRGFFTIMGVTVEEAVAGLGEAGADLVGSNCGNGIDNMIKLAELFVEHSRLPVIIQSNAGLPEMRDGVMTYSESPEYMASQCRRLLDLGVAIIGGCCGTTPEHIAAIRRIISEKP